MSAALAELPPIDLSTIIDPPPPVHPDPTGEVNYWPPSVWNHILFGWGCVRFDERDADGYVVPRLHMNEAHNTCGIVSVSASRDVPADKRDLQFVTEGGGAIGTMLFKPDETMTAMGVHTGPSGGQPNTRCPLYINGTRYPANSSKFYHPFANLWCFWVWAKGGPSPVVEAFGRVADVLDTHVMRLNALTVQNANLTDQLGQLGKRVQRLEDLVSPPVQEQPPAQ